MRLLEALTLRHRTAALILGMGCVAFMLSSAFFFYSALSNTTYAFFVLAGLTFLFLVGVTVLIAVHLKKAHSRQTHNLVRAIQAISANHDYSVRAKASDDDAFGELTESFNAMLAQIQNNFDGLRAAGHEAEAASRAKSELFCICN